MKNKTTTKQKVWTSGISPTKNLSYEKYLKAGLENISSKLSVRVYKLAPKEEYPIFQRGLDLRVGIFWDGKPAIDNKGRKYEFVVEVPFWVPANTNKEDRQWMRNSADVHLRKFYNALVRGNSDQKKKKKKTITKMRVGSTQGSFEKIKK